MNKSRLHFLSGFLFLTLILSGCSKNDSSTPEEPQPEPFDITDYYVAGTITPQSNSYTSVFLIKLLENNTAVFVGSGNDLTGTYTLTADSLLVTIEDPNNFRTARFAINAEHKLTSAYYRALTTEYNATGALLKIHEENQFAGKTFTGEEWVMGPSVSKPSWFYKFDASGNLYGSGDELTAIALSNSPEIINNSAFKYKEGNITELGFINGDSLTVFRLQGLYYFGTYKKQ